MGVSPTDQPLGNPDLSLQDRQGQVQRQRGPPQQSFLPLEIADILYPALKVGAGSGAVGVFVGYAAGIAKAAPPGSFALISGFQWFTLGTSYYATKSWLYKSWGGQENLSFFDKVKASSIAGSGAGLMGGLLRGPRNIIPGIIVGSLAGAGGQAVLGSIGNLHWGTKFLASKYSPLTPLTDRQYEHMLEEKLLKIEAEISIVDDNIKAVRDSAVKKTENTKQ